MKACMMSPKPYPSHAVLKDKRGAYEGAASLLGVGERGRAAPSARISVAYICARRMS